MFFLLGYWVNPYRAGDREYFWRGGFETRAEALAYGKRKQEYGQPTRFINWMAGSNRAFSSLENFKKAAIKAGLNPNLREYE